MKLALVLIVTLLSGASSANAASGFCYAVKSSGVYCTAIATMPPAAIASRACAVYARSMGASESGFFRNTDVGTLELRQEQECHYVANKPKYQCFVQETCTGAGTASSSLSPLDRYVFENIGSMDIAKSACVDKASADYLNALRSAGAGCLIGAKAVVTMP